jgi:hypothetical protein
VESTTCHTKTIRNDAYDYRVVHLQATLATYEALDPQGPVSQSATKFKIQRITRLLNTERMRRPFRAIHSAVSTLRTAGLTKLFVPTKAKNPKVVAKFCQPDGSLTKANLISMSQADKTSVEYATIIDCAEIEHELLQYNKMWFRQAHVTPFGHGKLYNLVGYDGLTEEATNIVSGMCIDHRELTVFWKSANVRTSLLTSEQTLLSTSSKCMSRNGRKQRPLLPRAVTLDTIALLYSTTVLLPFTLIC